MNIIEYKPVIVISLICICYCIFWVVVELLLSYFENRKMNQTKNKNFRKKIIGVWKDLTIIFKKYINQDSI